MKTYRCPDCGAVSVVQEYLDLPGEIDEGSSTWMECGDCGWQSEGDIVAYFDTEYALSYY